MPEFCENCPMRGDVAGEVEGVFSDQATFREPFLFRVETVSNVGIMTDSAGNMSNPFYLDDYLCPEDMVSDLVSKLDGCTSAEQTFWGKLLRNENLVSCPALSRQQLDNNEANRRLVYFVVASLRNDEHLLSREITKSRRFHPMNLAQA